ncbi:MAG: trypsin-like peptidase domain-containing protein [Candidatus Phytoplasma pruni]|uniref:trypsin-like peptidase domain-containing protein n=1 Tax=Milkweed yellows phytoplasma TaxID=208434 RepID=UPI00036CA531|nr:trypsin-like peptidase domain-containing protein [Milkweed yellows phytoplasma]
MYVNKIPKKYLFISFFIFLLAGFFYYRMFFNLETQPNLFHYNKNNQLFKTNDNDMKKKCEIIEKIHKNIQTVFEKEKNKEKPASSYELKRHKFHIGETVYAFTLDTKENIKPFQEGIISEDYDENNTHYLPISIKGKNNKIFFNTKGEFIGISLPDKENKNNKTEINYIITSNSMYNFLKCIIHTITIEEDEEFFQQEDTHNKFFLPIKIKEKGQEDKKFNIFLDQNGLFLGLIHQNFPEKVISFEQYLTKYLIDTYCSASLKNIEKPHHTELPTETISPLEDSSLSEKESLSGKIRSLSKLNFLINYKDFLGSGFIWDIDKIKDEYTGKIKYKYYLLTNRHVIEHAHKNEIIHIFNHEFKQKTASVYNYIDNKRDTDDIGIVTFIDSDHESFKKVEDILKTAKQPFLQQEPSLPLKEGEDIYSIGSQLIKNPKIPFTFVYENEILQNQENNYPFFGSRWPYVNPISQNPRQYPEINLLKKGSIIYHNEKEINFNIQIDSGNSGGMVFNNKGQIIGMNRSVLQGDKTTDSFSQVINMIHINERFEEMKQRLQVNPTFEDKNYQIIFQNKIKKFQNKFKDNKPSKINFFVQDLLLLDQKPIVISSSSQEKTKNTNKFLIYLVGNYDYKEEIFFMDPHQEDLEIHLNKIDGKKGYENLELIIHKRNKENKQISATYTRKFNNYDLYKGDNSFLSLELKNAPKKEKIDLSDKIKNSLIVWHKGNGQNGNGVILHQQRLANNKFLYYVLSNCNNDYEFEDQKYEKMDNWINNFINIFSDEINIITSTPDEGKRKEKGHLQSFLFDKNNLILLTFESDYNYPIAEMTKISDLKIGQEAYYLFNSDNKVNFPQFFKSKVGSLKGNSALFDSVFNLKHKKKTLNFLFFDKDNRFIGINDVVSDNFNTPLHFIKTSNIKEKSVVELFRYQKLKNNANQIFSIIFLNIILFIVIIFLPNDDNKKNKWKKIHI